MKLLLLLTLSLLSPSAFAVDASNVGVAIIPNNTLKLGKPNTSDSKTLEFNRNQATGFNPKIRMSSQRITFSNDGTTFYPLTTDSASMVENLTLSVTASGGDLTVALKTKADTDPSTQDPIRIAFRNPTNATGNYTVRTITSATSGIVHANSRLGLSAANIVNLPPAGSGTARLWHYIVDSDGAGTLKICNAGIRIPDTARVTTKAERVVWSNTDTGAAETFITSTAHGLAVGDSIGVTCTGSCSGVTTNPGFHVLTVPSSTSFTMPSSTAAPWALPIKNITGAFSPTGTAYINYNGWDLACDAVYTNVSAKLIGWSTWATSPSGTWTTPTLVSLNTNVPDPVNVIAYGWAGGVLSGSDTFWGGGTITRDSHGLYDSASGTFHTIPLQSIYNVCGKVRITSTWNSAAGGLGVETYVNGTGAGGLVEYVPGSSPSPTPITTSARGCEPQTHAGNQFLGLAAYLIGSMAAFTPGNNTASTFSFSVNPSQ